MRALLREAAIVILMLAAFAPIAAAAGQPPSSSLARAAAEREAALARTIAAAPTDPLAYFALARFQEEFGAFVDAEATLLKARRALATNKEPDHLGAIASKVLLLRLSAEFQNDPAEKTRIMDEAAALLVRGMALARENEAPPPR